MADLLLVVITRIRSVVATSARRVVDLMGIATSIRLVAETGAQ